MANNNSAQGNFPPPPGMPGGMGQDPYYDQQNSQMPPMQNYPDQGYQDNNQYQDTDDGGVERFEELAEAIINEKWNELLKDINKIIEWKERTDTDLKRMQQEILNLNQRFESLHKGVLGKITEYDSNLTNVGSEIQAMQMAFQKILPTFTENVNKLERITKGVSQPRQ